MWYLVLRSQTSPAMQYTYSRFWRENNLVSLYSMLNLPALMMHSRTLFSQSINFSVNSWVERCWGGRCWVLHTVLPSLPPSPTTFWSWLVSTHAVTLRKRFPPTGREAATRLNIFFVTLSLRAQSGGPQSGRGRNGLWDPTVKFISLHNDKVTCLSIQSKV